MASIADLKQQRAEKKDAARKLHDAVEAEDVSELDGIDSVDEADELADKVVDKAEELDERIDQLEARRAKLEGLTGDDSEDRSAPDGRQAFEGVRMDDDLGGDSEEDAETVQKRAFRKWLAYGPDSLEGRETDFVSRTVSKSRAEYNFGLDNQDAIRMNQLATEFRSTALMGTTALSGQTGGNLVPREFLEELFEDIEDIGAMRDVADVRRTDTGRTLDIPLKDDNTAQGEYVVEGATIASTTEITYSQTQLHANRIQAGPIKVSFQLLDDSAFSMEEEIRSEIAARISNREEDRFVNGSTNTTSPAGINTIISTSTGAINVPGGSSNLTAADLRNLKYDSTGLGLKAGWRMQDPVWMMSGSGWNAVVNLEDGDGRSLVRGDLTADTDPQLLGDRVIVNERLDSFGSTGALPIWYGVFDQAYMIRDVNQLRLIRFDEKFATEGAVGFLGTMRNDGRPVFASTLASRRPIVALQQATT